MKRMLVAVGCAVLMLGMMSAGIATAADAKDAKIVCPQCKGELVRGKPGYPKDLGIYTQMTQCPSCGKEHKWVGNVQEYIYICEKDKSAYELCDMCIAKLKEKPAEPAPAKQ